MSFQLFRDLHIFYVQHFLLAQKFWFVVHNGFSSHQFSQVYVERVITPKAKRTFVNDVIQTWGGGGLHNARCKGGSNLRDVIYEWSLSSPLSKFSN